MVFFSHGDDLDYPVVEAFLQCIGACLRGELCASPPKKRTRARKEPLSDRVFSEVLKRLAIAQPPCADPEKLRETFDLFYEVGSHLDTVLSLSLSPDEVEEGHPCLASLREKDCWAGVECVRAVLEGVEALATDKKMSREEARLRCLEVFRGDECYVLPPEYAEDFLDGLGDVPGDEPRSLKTPWPSAPLLRADVDGDGGAVQAGASGGVPGPSPRKDVAGSGLFILNADFINQILLDKKERKTRGDDGLAEAGAVPAESAGGAEEPSEVEDCPEMREARALVDEVVGHRKAADSLCLQLAQRLAETRRRVSEALDVLRVLGSPEELHARAASERDAMVQKMAGTVADLRALQDHRFADDLDSRLSSMRSSEYLEQCEAGVKKDLVARLASLGFSADSDPAARLAALESLHRSHGIRLPPAPSSPGAKRPGPDARAGPSKKARPSTLDTSFLESFKGERVPLDEALSSKLLRSLRDLPPLKEELGPSAVKMLDCECSKCRPRTGAPTAYHGKATCPEFALRVAWVRSDGESVGAKVWLCSVNRTETNGPRPLGLAKRRVTKPSGQPGRAELACVFDDVYGESLAADSVLCVFHRKDVSSPDHVDLVLLHPKFVESADMRVLGDLEYRGTWSNVDRLSKQQCVDLFGSFGFDDSRKVVVDGREVYTTLWVPDLTVRDRSNKSSLRKTIQNLPNCPEEFKDKASLLKRSQDELTDILRDLSRDPARP